MKICKLTLFCVFTSLLFCVSSCSPTFEGSINPVLSSKNDSLAVYTAFLRSLGFKDTEIEFDEKRERFVIDDDISTTLSDVRERYAIFQREKGAKPKQYRWAYLVNQSTVHNIRVYVDPTVPNNWRSALTQAIENWNSLSENNVTFKPIYTSANANVTITTVTLANKPNTLANSDLPQMSGNPGAVVAINTNSTYYNSTDSNILKLALTHELGHTIGLMHTDELYDNPTSSQYNASVSHIPTTPQAGQDPNSIMNSVLSSTRFFTTGDLIAIRILYPFTWDSLVEKPWGASEEGFGTIYITWDNTVSNSTVKIELYRSDGTLAGVIDPSASNTGSYYGSVTDIAEDGYYTVKVSFNDGNPSHSDYSDNQFYYRTF